MNSIERAECCRHGLGRPLKDNGVDFDEFERGDQLQDGDATTRHPPHQPDWRAGDADPTSGDSPSSRARSTPPVRPLATLSAHLAVVSRRARVRTRQCTQSPMPGVLRVTIARCRDPVSPASAVEPDSVEAYRARASAHAAEIDRGWGRAARRGCRGPGRRSFRPRERHGDTRSAALQSLLGTVSTGNRVSELAGLYHPSGRREDSFVRDLSVSLRSDEK